MMTEKGRVVYERKEHKFTTLAIVRIIKKTSESENILHVARNFAKIAIAYWMDEYVSYVMKVGFIIGMLVPMSKHLKIALDVMLEALRKAHEILSELWFGDED